MSGNHEEETKESFLLPRERLITSLTYLPKLLEASDRSIKLHLLGSPKFAQMVENWDNQTLMKILEEIGEN